MPLLVTDRTSRRKISRNIDDLDNTKSQLDLVGIYKTLYTQQQQNIDSSQVQTEHSQNRPYSTLRQTLTSIK